MNLYKLTQYEKTGYDTYDSVVVAAESIDQAKNFNPEGSWSYNHNWCSSPEHVSAEMIGTATEGTPEGIILASFNAA